VRLSRPDGESWFNAFRFGGRAPGDVVAVAVYVLLVDLAVVLPVVGETWVRTLLGLPLVFFLPGYVLVSVLFPRRATASARRADDRERIDWTERAALSVGGSLVVLPVLALVLGAVGLGLSGSVVVATLSLFVVAGMGTAAVRRWRVPPEDRLRSPVGRLLEGGRARLADDRRGQLLQFAVAGSVVLATTTLAFGFAATSTSNDYTSVALLTEDDSGDLVASGYPTNMTRGESEQLILELGNREGEETTYTVVVALERVRTGGDDPAVVERTVLTRLEETVAANETATLRHEVAPSMTGDDLRLSYYVYRGSAPESPSADSAYRHLFLMVNVST
jgi:uncharacterized membrane protein